MGRQATQKEMILFEHDINHKHQVNMIYPQPFLGRLAVVALLSACASSALLPPAALCFVRASCFACERASTLLSSCRGSHFRQLHSNSLACSAVRALAPRFREMHPSQKAAGQASQHISEPPSPHQRQLVSAPSLSTANGSEILDRQPSQSSAPVMSGCVDDAPSPQAVQAVLALDRRRTSPSCSCICGEYVHSRS